MILTEPNSACIAGIIRITKLDTLRSMDVTCESLSLVSAPFRSFTVVGRCVGVWLTDVDQCVPCLNLSVIECTLGIICVSIPPLRPLLARIFPSALPSSRSASSKSPLHSLQSKRVSRIRADPERHPESKSYQRFDAEAAGCDSHSHTTDGALDPKTEEIGLAR